MKFSSFARSLTGDSGTHQLMDDLGEAASSDREYIMLGGGNPGPVPAMQALFRQEMHALADNPVEFDRIVRGYDSPQGDHEFRQSVATCLRDECGWNVGPEHIAITNGSQSGFFLLFNALAGSFDDGSNRHIVLPLTPEYIGYADLGISDAPLFRSARPVIEQLDEQRIKYRIDFDALKTTPETGALCISRPTNPTGNVITDNEVRKLQDVARDAGVPLIIDGAYGLPFPGMVFGDATPLHDDNTIVCLSLSKLGLAGMRTGIMVGPEDVIKTVSKMNALMNLAPSSAGPGLMLDTIRRGDIVRISKEHIQPFYADKARRAQDVLASVMGDTPWRIHNPEGAFFLWTWFPDLPVHSQTLYERLKERGVMVIPGHDFFPGLEDDPWEHKTQCMRITYAQDDASVHAGLQILADEVKRAYDEA